MDCTSTLGFLQRQRCEGRGTAEVGSITSHAGKWSGRTRDSTFPVGLSPLQEKYQEDETKLTAAVTQGEEQD